MKPLTYEKPVEKCFVCGEQFLFLGSRDLATNFIFCDVCWINIRKEFFAFGKFTEENWLLAIAFAKLKLNKNLKITYIVEENDKQ